MDTGAGWWGEVRRVALVFSVALLLGWISGELLMALAVAAVLLILIWLRQLWRVSDWLRNASEEPPEADGLWGEMFDSVYHLQRRDREERDRLQTTVSYLRDSFAALKEGAVMIDPDGRIEWSNAAAERLLGLQYPRDRGQAILNLLRIPHFHQYFNTGDFQKPLSLDSPIHADTHLLLEITPFGHGSRLMFARDISREQRLEQMRRDFVANVSHELRTPLTVITGYLHTLLDHYSDDDSRLRRPLVQMEEQAARMETLLKDLLWLSRMESMESGDELTRVKMLDLLTDVKRQLQDAWPGRLIEIHAPGEPSVQGNYRELYSAVSNLVLNALKYSDAEVNLNLHEEEGSLILDVTDHGSGIDAVHLPRLTERFYRVDKSRSVETGGTGLGLAIVKHVLARHDAQLKIDSQPGVGSTFSCHFPLS